MKKLFILLPILLVFISIFRVWFLNGTVSGFDHPYFYTDRIKEFTFFPTVWDSVYGNGFGENLLKYFWVETYLRFVSQLYGNILKLPWEMIQRLSWFLPFIVISLVSPYYFIKSLNLFQKNYFSYALSIIIYSLNTYILMVVAGGQMNLALAYSVTPLVFITFIKNTHAAFETNKLHLKLSLITGLTFALLVMLDLRYALLIFLASASYFCFYILFFQKKHLLKSILTIFVIPFITVFLVHSYWIIPLLQFHSIPVDEVNTLQISGNLVSFLSFARFENTLSLLHPNWPENIFGKVYFMRPEFLFIPIIAFGSLLFIQKEKEKKKRITIVFFALLGLLGAFLAKGANDPFGSFYLWAFNHIPGFVLFRDSSKFYIYIALAYTVLVPYSIVNFYKLLQTKLNNKTRTFLSKLFIIVVMLYFIFLINPAITGKLPGTLSYHKIPQEYQKLADFLRAQPDFSRTAWFPEKQKYAYLTSKHPAISLVSYFKTNDQKKLLAIINNPKTQTLFQEASIHYIIVPYDPDGEIFVNDGHYSDQEYKKTIKEIEGVKWLKRVATFKILGVFEVENYKDHFWVPSQKFAVTYKPLSQTEYQLDIKNGIKGDRVIFNDYYDDNWTASVIDSKQLIGSQKYNRYNSFILPKNGNYSLKIFYKTEQQVLWHIYFSLIILLMIVAYLAL
jgi:hypothetical protein